MNLTLGKVKATITPLFFLTAILTIAAPALAQAPTSDAQTASSSAAQPPPPPPCVDQSPRNLNMDLKRTGPPAQGFDYNFVSGVGLVKPLDGDKVEYQRRVLELCDRHYHTPVENLQGCPNEKPPAASDAANLAGPPPVGAWVEVHSVYAATVDRSGECSTGHDHNLKCCVQPPFVVLGYSARIAEDDHLSPGTKFAEWSGSATTETPTKCNTTPARWRFTLGCEARLTQATLERNVGGKAHSARALQGPNLVSSDLTFLGPAYSTAVCRKVRTEPIADDSAARRICPGVCKWPLNRYNGDWSRVPGGALCDCCPLDRPQ